MDGESGVDDLIQSRVIEADLQSRALMVLKGKESCVQAICHKIGTTLTQYHSYMEDLRRTSKEQKHQIEEMKMLHATLEKTLASIKYMEKNIPAHYSCQVPNVLVEVSTNGDYSIEENIPPSPPPASTELVTPIHHKNVVKLKSAPKSDNAFYCDTLSFLTQTEFDNMPGYLRGSANLKYDEVNAFIVCFNAALTAKYRLLAIPNPRIREREVCKRYKKEECKDTKGLYFISDEDLKDSGHNKPPKTVVTLLGILRNAKRMREIRTQGVVRYAVTSS